MATGEGSVVDVEGLAAADSGCGCAADAEFIVTTKASRASAARPPVHVQETNLRSLMLEV
jgi:hypothetical protein